MEKIPASTGWLWLKQGFALFRQQPGGMSLLFLMYVVLMMCAGVIPWLGEVLPIVLVPVFSISFMRACQLIDAKQRVLPILLGSGFEKPVFPRLLGLGVLYLLAAVLAVGLSALVDNGTLWNIAIGALKPTEELARSTNLGGAVMLAFALYIPAAMAFCFAGPLIYWQKMSLAKAIFYSFFSVLHSLKAFIVFAAAWFAVSIISTQLISLLFGRGPLAVMFLAPVSVVLTMVMHCSVYSSYKQLFGAPPEAETDLPAKPLS